MIDPLFTTEDFYNDVRQAISSGIAADLKRLFPQHEVTDCPQHLVKIVINRITYAIRVESGLSDGLVTIANAGARTPYFAQQFELANPESLDQLYEFVGRLT